MNSPHPPKPTLAHAVQLVGMRPLAKACGVTIQSIQKWLASGYLPRTDYTGETDYASVIAREVEAKAGTPIVTADDLRPRRPPMGERSPRPGRPKRAPVTSG